MDWSNERYVRLYTRDTTDWITLSWEARALFHELLRKVDRAGVIQVGKSGAKSLALLVRMPVDVVERAMHELVSDGCLMVSVDGNAVIPNFLEAQETPQSDKQRARESRARRRDQIRNGLRPDEREEVVYFVQSEDGGPIKIGFTEDLARRLIQLQASRPDRLVVLATIRGDVSTERETHARFSHLRMSGEWFSPADELMEYVRSLSSPGSGVTSHTGPWTENTETGHETKPVTPSLAKPTCAEASPTNCPPLSAEPVSFPRQMHKDEPLTDYRRSRVDSLTMNTGAKIDIVSQWVTFRGTRVREKRMYPDGSAIDADWDTWIGRAMRFESRDRVRDQERAASASAAKPKEDDYSNRRSRTKPPW